RIVAQRGDDPILTGADSTGSVVVARDKAGSRETGYSAWGYRPAGEGEVGYNGERTDPVSGISLPGNGYRGYDPELMRFDRPDDWSPFGAGGLNPYAYCGGDPVNHTDPSGHVDWSAVAGIALGAAGLIAAAVTGGLSIAAAGGVMAALETASVVSLTVGTLAAGADVAAMGSGIAALAGQGRQSSALGWLSLGLGVPGAVAGIGGLVRAGMRGGRQLAGAFSKGLGPTGADVANAARAFSIDSTLLRALVQRNMDIADLLNADFEIPRYIYRGSAWRLNFSTMGGRDRRLAAILQHTSSSVGSMGTVQSFSTEKTVAESFFDAEVRGRGRGFLYKVDTQSHGEFITAPQLLLKYGDYLIKENRVSEEELKSALGWALAAQEHEVFFVIEEAVPGKFVGLQPTYETLKSVLSEPPS
ncbi:RHS repeat-associated core domain-containing protein, partial [Enterobacter asburiae]